MRREQCRNATRDDNAARKSKESNSNGRRETSDRSAATRGETELHGTLKICGERINLDQIQQDPALIQGCPSRATASGGAMSQDASSRCFVALLRRLLPSKSMQVSSRLIRAIAAVGIATF